MSNKYARVVSLDHNTRRVNEQNTDHHQSPINFRKTNLDSRSPPPLASGDIAIPTNSESDNHEQEELSHQQDLSTQLLTRLQHGELLIINPRRKNGLILYKEYHAEFAGPGAIVGGEFDRDVSRLLAVGNLSCVSPGNSEEKKQAYKMRRQWVRLTKQIIDNPVPIERAQVILNQFEHWFDDETVAKLPDEAFALLVGVLPQTIRKVRNIELL